MTEKYHIDNIVIELFRHAINFPNKAPLILSTINQNMLPKSIRPLLFTLDQMIRNHRSINSQTFMFWSENYYTYNQEFYKVVLDKIKEMPDIDLSIIITKITEAYQKRYIKSKMEQINSVLNGNYIWKPELVVDHALDMVIELEKQHDSDILPKNIISDKDSLIPFVRRDLNLLLGGKVRGELMTICAESAHGKSRFTLNLAKEDLEAGYKVNFFNIEMRNQQAIQIIMANETGIDSEKIIKNPKVLSKEEIELIEDSYKQFTKNYVDTKKLKMYQSLNRVEEINAALVRDKPDVAYIDWFQLMEMPETTMNKAVGLPIIIASLLKTCKKLNIALIGVAQIEIRNRSGWRKRPTSDDISDSSFFKKASADIIALFRPFQVFQNKVEYYNIFEIIYMKSRFGQPGYTFNKIEPEYARFGQKVELNQKTLNQYRLESGLN